MCKAHCLHISLFVFLSSHIQLLLCSENTYTILCGSAFSCLSAADLCQLDPKRRSCCEQHVCAESDTGSDSVQTILNLLPDAAKAAILQCLEHNQTDVGEDTQTLASSSRYKQWPPVMQHTADYHLWVLDLMAAAWLWTLQSTRTSLCRAV